MSPTPEPDRASAETTSALSSGDHEDAGRVVLTEPEMGRALRRIAHEILEANKGARDLVLVGIPTRGGPLAHRLAAAIHEVEGHLVPSGTLDITMYRDDLRGQPVRQVEPTQLPDGGIDDKVVVLVDDVLYSGRTVRAALDSLADYGRPRIVRLAVLIDRGHRELPIRPDYVGKNLPSAKTERVSVHVREVDGHDEVSIATGPRREVHR